jgi:hypothetical protein
VNAEELEKLANDASVSNMECGYDSGDNEGNIQIVSFSVEGGGAGDYDNNYVSFSSMNMIACKGLSYLILSYTK